MINRFLDILQDVPDEYKNGSFIRLNRQYPIVLLGPKDFTWLPRIRSHTNFRFKSGVEKAQTRLPFHQNDVAE